MSGKEMRSSEEFMSDESEGKTLIVSQKVEEKRKRKTRTKKKQSNKRKIADISISDQNKVSDLNSSQLDSKTSKRRKLNSNNDFEEKKVDLPTKEASSSKKSKAESKK